MEIAAALVSFAALLAAWIVAPDRPRQAPVPTTPVPDAEPATA